MSGVEVAGLALGALPILIEAVKAYQSTTEKIHTFRHYSRDVKRLHCQLQTHKQNFLNECHLILRLVVDSDQKAQAMLADSRHQSWRDPQLSVQLNKRLQGNYQSCRAIIEDTWETLDEIEKDVACFDVLQSHSQDGEPFRVTIRRVRKSIKVAFEKDKYERKLSTLRERNMDLLQLRSYLGEFQQRRLLSSSKSYDTNEVYPSHFSAVHQASLTLYDALKGSWTCEHASHAARLCLDATADESVHLELAIQHYQKTGTVPSSMPATKPKCFMVQSTIVPCSMTQSVPLDPDVSELRQTLTSVSADVEKSVLRASPQPVASTVSTEPKTVPNGSIDASTSDQNINKRKRVRFGNDDNDESMVTVYAGKKAKSTDFQTVIPPNDLVGFLKHKSICLRLHAPRETSLQHCMGYLVSHHDALLVKHYFASTGGYLVDQVHGAENINFKSLEQALQQPLDKDISIVDQLKLARTVAVAVLRFHSTPWLGREWRIRDLAFFEIQSQLSEIFRTLHLSAYFAPALPSSPTPMDDVETAENPSNGHPHNHTTEDTDLMYGINNRTLFSLGVALLELGHLKPLSQLRRDTDSFEFFTARRLSEGQTPLGPKYQDIIRRCLQCNFGYGTDLNKVELQRAVYGDVVCQLENMIEALTI